MLLQISHQEHHLRTDRDDYNNNNKYELISLENQILFQEQFILSTIKTYNYNNYQLFLIGHSIGSYFIQKILQQNNQINEKTIKISLLMPFFLWNNLPNYNKIFLKLFEYTSEWTTTIVIKIFKFIINKNSISFFILKNLLRLTSSIDRIIGKDLIIELEEYMEGLLTIR